MTRRRGLRQRKGTGRRGRRNRYEKEDAEE
jgi:hypothetical protein